MVKFTALLVSSRISAVASLIGNCVIKLAQTGGNMGILTLQITLVSVLSVTREFNSMWFLCDRIDEKAAQLLYLRIVFVFIFLSFFYSEIF